MPIVPRVDTEIARPDALPRVRNEARVSAQPAQRLAEAVSGTMAGVAATVTEVYQREADRADTASYMEAQRKLADWRNRWTDPNNDTGMASYKGREALRLGEAMLPDYDATVSEIAAALPSERAREKFMQYAGDTRASTAGDINRYASAQNEAYLAQQRTAYLQTQANTLVGAQLSDPQRYKQAWAATLDTIYADAAANGDAPEATALTIANLQSGVHVGVLDQLVTDDPIAAQAYYAEHADELQEADRARVLRVLDPLYEDARAEEDAEAALAGGSFHAPATRNPEAIQRDFAGFADRFGLTLTSTTRTPAENDAVNGVANSQHMTGTAADYRTTGVPEERIRAFMAAARAAGYEVHDERKQTRGTGPHIHLELPPGATVAGQGGAASEADALERVMAIRDPERRRLAAAKIKDRFTLDKMRREEQDRAMTEAIHTAVWTAEDPTAPLARVLDKEQFAYAASKGWVGQLANDLRGRATAPVLRDNAEVLAPYLETARTNPGAFVRMDVVRNSRHLTAGTVKALTDLQQDYRDGKHGPSAFAAENDQLEALIFAPLNMIGQTTEAKRKRAPIETAWYEMKAEWANDNPGKTLDAATRDGMIRRLRTAFALKNTEGFERFAIAPADRAAIVDAFRAKGIEPTEEQVNRAYLIGGGR